MNTKILWVIVVAVVVSFVSGFLLANALNRNELSGLRSENELLKNTQTDSAKTNAEFSLTEDELRRKVAEADANPTDIDFQKNLGIALYRYAAMKQDAKLLSESARLLSRVHEKDSSDSEVTITLGNAFFDIGYFNKENESFEKSRVFYRRALEQKPGNADVRTDLGLTYFLVNPPENERAIAEFQKSLQANPSHEKTLQVMTQVLIAENKSAEAERFLAKLKQVNSANQIVPQLESQIAQIRDNSQKQ